MIHSIRFKALLDTNVIYPVIIRDLLFWFAYYELYTIKWSRHIFDEWEEIMIRKGVSLEECKKRIKNANDAFPDAFVTGYEELIPLLTLPDDKDCHVLAAAIKTNAHVIVSNNVKDFPEEALAGYALDLKTADAFLTDIIDLNSRMAVQAFKDMVVNKKNPHYDEWEVLQQLRRSGLKDAADYLHTFL